MSNFLQHYTLKYTPLSPIHIGTGESYEPTNYVIDDGTLYEFDTGGAVAALSATDRTELSKIVTARPDTRMLKAVQKFFYDRREALKPWCVNAIPALEGVVRLYESRVGKTANLEGGGGEIINKLEIDRTAYNPVTRQPVLYGSSIKGAIRTALLNQKNDKKPLLLIDDRRTGRRRRENNHELQQRLFEFRAGKFELDPMRLVQVGDAAWNSQDNLPSAQVYLTVNRKKYQVIDERGNERPSQAENNKNLFKLLECVPAWHYRAFSAQLNIQQVNGLQGNSASSKLPKNELRFTMPDIAKTCNSFYLPILKAEIKLMHERGFLDAKWVENIQKLLAEIAGKMLDGQVFLLRIGHHSGAESVTLNGVRNIKILKGNPEYQQQTKTLWLAAQTKDQRTDMLPFGWVLVEVAPDNAPECDWSELAELCASQHEEARYWAQQQAQQGDKLAEKRQEAELRREREAIERRRQAEQAAQAEQARLAKQQAEELRLASMTDEQLQIDSLRQKLQQKQAANLCEQIGGPLYSDMRELINQASAWSAGDKAELLGLARQILEFINAGGNKKAKELLKTLQ